MAAVGGSIKADHLCVLVHGLWGNPNHMKSIAESLRAQFSPDDLYLLLAKRNSGSFTYDGIELGGERVCAEIEDELRAVEARGGKIKKLSIVGYSLGGLVSRYAVGLLNAKGVLDTVKCMNFVTFASPHLGVRTPRKGWSSHLWNVLGARTLSMSGRQLFTIDKFRDTERPLLSVLADPSSIFMNGLRKFDRHTLYANVIHDNSVVWYTSAIQKTDPFKKINDLTINYTKGFQDVVMDRTTPYHIRPKIPRPMTWSSASESVWKWTKNVPLIITIALLVPIGVVGFLVNSGIQTVRSSFRIKLHESGAAGVSIDTYRVPLLLKELRGEVENAYGALSNSQNQEFLAADDEDDSQMAVGDREVMVKERRMSMPTQPTLALTPDQFEMIRSLDSLGWRKYPVWIHKHRHSHAAIILRMDKKSHQEGRVVLKHFATQEFVL